MLLFRENPDNHKSFYGRDRERQRLEAAITNERGGTVLVSGDRGAGKTSLVNSVLEGKRKATRRKYSFLRLTRDYFVQVDLPFIPKHLLNAVGNEADGADKNMQNVDQPANFRADMSSLVLRALAQTLVAENETRRRKWLDIRRAWFRPIGYVVDLKKLDKLTKYINIKETRSRSFGIKKAISATDGLSQESELDLSDTIVEVTLRKLLQTYSPRMTFVFVFDELDKLEDNLLAIQIVVYLKNLFTQCGAHFIFITTELTYNRLEQAIQAKPYSEEYTLFTERILLNSMPPTAFTAWISQLFNGDAMSDSESKSLSQLTRALSWETKNHPYDALRMLRESTVLRRKKYYLNIDDLKKRMGTATWDTFGVLQSFIDYLVTENREGADGYYNRYLYKALRVACQNLYNANDLLVSRRNALSLLYSSDEFADSNDEAARKLTFSFSAPPVLTPPLGDDWREGLFKLSREQVVRIERSLLDLLWFLDRVGGIEAGETGNGDNLLMVNFNDDTLSHDYLLSIPVNPYRMDQLGVLSAQETSLLDQSVKMKGAYKRVFGTEPWSLYGARFIDSTQSSGLSIPEGARRHRFACDLSAYEKSLKGSDHDLKVRFMENVKEKIRNLPNITIVEEDELMFKFNFMPKTQQYWVIFEGSIDEMNSYITSPPVISSYPLRQLEPHVVNIVSIDSNYQKQSAPSYKTYTVAGGCRNTSLLINNIFNWVTGLMQ